MWFREWRNRPDAKAIEELEHATKRSRTETIAAENRLRAKIEITQRDLERVPVAAAFSLRRHFDV